MSTVTLTMPELADLLGVTERQVRFATQDVVDDHRETRRGVHRDWTPDQVRQLQVAAKLASATGNFPVAVRAVFANPHEPEPGTWAVMKDSAVSYVRYSADLFRLVGDVAVVARLEHLWPDVPTERS